MENTSKLNSDSFKKFIVYDEGKRGYIICLKGEANTTIRSFFRGLFLFFFTRRITSLSSYNEKPIRVITNNYVDRINAGLIEIYPKQSIKQCILELENEFEEKNKKFWSANSSNIVRLARILQRANCYLNALNKGVRDDDFVNGKVVQYKNTDNSVKRGLSGVFEGVFGGVIGFALTLFILWATLYLIVFMVELF